ncbi:MAG: glycosyltransferase [Pseudomonadota bacterium]
MRHSDKTARRYLRKNRRPTVLVLLGCFWPGHEANGPNQSLNAMVAALRDDYEFKVVGRDRAFAAPDTSSTRPGWYRSVGFTARHLPVSHAGASGLRSLLRETHYDILVLNGFFDREFTLPALTLRRFHQTQNRPVIVAPRGEFSPGALSLKANRKRAFLKAARASSLCRGVTIHATSDSEASDIRREAPWLQNICVAPNIRQSNPVGLLEQQGSLTFRIAFLSRIDRKKNLDFALRVLRSTNIEIQFDIFGPITDAVYWTECQTLIERLPPNVKAQALGAVPQAQLSQTLRNYDLFFLPTAGENFAHAIYDALEAGVPVLISDQTPFRNLNDQKAGFDLPLHSPELFAEAIKALANQSQTDRSTWRHSARALFERTLQSDDAVQKTKAMFEAALAEPIEGRAA